MSWSSLPLNQKLAAVALVLGAVRSSASRTVARS